MGHRSTTTDLDTDTANEDERSLILHHFNWIIRQEKIEPSENKEIHSTHKYNDTSV